MAGGLEAVFRPRSIAVVGASADSGKRGHQAVRALIASGYEGQVHPVHPAGGELLGLPVAPSIAAVGRPIDLAFVATRAETIVDNLRECAAAGVRAAVVPAVGFGETGEAGGAREREIRSLVESTGLRVLGPNTSGVLNTAVGLNLIGLSDVEPGPLAIVTQSGNMALALVREATRAGRGVSVVVGVGNQVDVDLADVLSYLAQDVPTRAIALYAESFGDGRRFLEAVADLRGEKPVVALVGGRSAAGKRAARSHTGALAGSYAIASAALKQVGVVEVDRSDELTAVALSLIDQPAADPERGLAVLSDGGGHGTIAVDALEALGVPLADLSTATRDRLRAHGGAAASVVNPVDLAGAADRDPSAFVDAFETLLADRGVGGVLLVGLFGGYALRFDPSLAEAELVAAEAMASGARDANRPLVVHTLYADARTPPLSRLAREGIPVVGSIEVAARCAAALWTRRVSGWTPHLGEPDARRTAGERRAGRTAGTELEARALVEAHGVVVAPAELCATPEEAAAAAERIGAPVAVRAVSATILHKSEAGGVRLDVAGPKAAAAAFEAVTEAVSRTAATRGMEPAVVGALVGPMHPPPIAELLIGVRRDPRFGPVLVIGAGGVATELLADRSIRVLPVTDDEIEHMSRELRANALLDGWRGREPAARSAIVAVARSLVDAALDRPDLEAIEINPLFAYSDRALAIDVRIV